MQAGRSQSQVWIRNYESRPKIAQGRHEEPTSGPGLEAGHNAEILNPLGFMKLHSFQGIADQLAGPKADGGKLDGCPRFFKGLHLAKRKRLEACSKSKFKKCR